MGRQASTARSYGRPADKNGANRGRSELSEMTVCSRTLSGAQKAPMIRFPRYSPSGPRDISFHKITSCCAGSKTVLAERPSRGNSRSLPATRDFTPAERPQCLINAAGSTGRCNTLLILLIRLCFSKRPDPVGCTQLNLNMAVFSLNQRSRRNLAVETSADWTSGRCCVDPLRPARLLEKWVLVRKMSGNF
jgi:hypothetical protein